MGLKTAIFTLWVLSQTYWYTPIYTVRHKRKSKFRVMKNVIFIRIFYLLTISNLLTNYRVKEQTENSLEKVELKNCRITELTLPIGWKKTEQKWIYKGKCSNILLFRHKFCYYYLWFINEFWNSREKTSWQILETRKIMIIYGNVTKERKMIFDKAFDEMKKNMISNFTRT